MATAAIDWRTVDEELEAVPPQYREQRFYALKHVVDIFSGKDPQALTAELRETEERLSELVDEVVEGFHVGFAKSIQNYSHILELFKDSKEQVEFLKRSLADSSRQLGAHSKLLNQQWRRSLTLTASQRLLDDIQAVVDVPHQIEAALGVKDWPTAVHHLLDGCTKLARGELMQVPALSKLREDMGGLSRWILASMCEELQSRAYSNFSASTSSSDSPTSHGLRGRVRHGGRKPASLGLQRWSEPRIGGKNRGKRANGLPHNDSVILWAADSDVSIGPDQRISTRQLVACLAQVDGVREAKAFLHQQMRDEMHRVMLRAAEASAGFASPAAFSNLEMEGLALLLGTTATSAHQLVENVCSASLQLLVSLITVLTEVSAAPATPGVSGLGLLHAQDEGFTQAMEAAAQARKGLAATYRGGGLTLKLRAFYMKRETTYAWQQLQEEFQLLLSGLLQAPLRNPSDWPAQAEATVEVAKVPGEGFNAWMENFADKAEAFVSNRIETLGQLGASLTGHASTAAAGSPAAAAAAAASAAAGKQGATMVQSHTEATPGGPSSTGEAAQIPKQRREQSKLAFAFEVLVPGLEEDANWAGADVPDAEGAGYGRTIQRALGGRQGSSYLTPAVYAPVLAFVESAKQLLLEEENERPGGPDGAGGPGSGIPAATWLQRYVEEFIVDTFLPQVWVDLRGRVTAALDDRNAFVSRPGFGSTSVASAAPQSGCVLPAAAFTTAVLQELSSWAQAMPAYEAAFVGVGQHILGRVLDAHTAKMTAVLGDCKAGALAARPDVAHAMACEPDARWLGHPIAFYVPKSTDTADVTGFLGVLQREERPVLVPSLLRVPSKHRGWANGGSPAEVELIMYVFKEKLGSVEALLTHGTGASSALIRLAALSESCDYVADLTTAWAGTMSPPDEDTISTAATVKTAGMQVRRGFRAAAGVPVKALRRLGLGLVTGKLGHVFAKDVHHAAVASDAAASTTPHSNQPLEGLPPKLWLLVHRYKAVGGACARAMRLEMMLLSAHHMRALATTSHICEGEDAKEAHPEVGVLTRAASRATDEMAPYLSTTKLYYISGGLSAATPRLIMWLLPDIQEINSLGVERMVRSLSVLQPALINLCTRPALPQATINVLVAVREAASQAAAHPLSDGPHPASPPPRSSLKSGTAGPLHGSGSGSRLGSGTRLGSTGAMSAGSDAEMTGEVGEGWEEPDDSNNIQAGIPAQVVDSSGSVMPSGWRVDSGLSKAGTLAFVEPSQRVFEHARAYYSLLTAPTEEVLRLAAESPFKYSSSEWTAVLQVHVPHRLVTDAHLQQMQRLLAVAHGQTSGQKVADVMGSVLTSIQVPGEKLTEVLVDLKDTLLAGTDTLLAGVTAGGKLAKTLVHKLQHVRG